MKQQYILNLTNCWLYFVGRGNMAEAAFIRDLRAWDWSFCFLFSTFHHRFPILLEPSRRVSGMMSSCSAKGPRTPQRRINTIHVSFTSAPYHCVHLRMCLMLVSVRHLFLTPQRGRLRFCHSLKQWSHISEQSVHGTLRRHAHRAAGVCSGVFGFFVLL